MVKFICVASIGSFRRCGIAFLLAWSLDLSACHRAAEPAASKPTAEPAINTPPEPASVPGEDDPAALPLPEDENRWLFVQKAKDGAAGAWATGSFIAERNKIDVQTHDVEEFSLDVGRIPIDWSRLVIIGIDGRNAELRKRDEALYHFVRDPQRGWVVREPPTRP